MSSEHNRPKVGLALSGGVARGPVHVGVLAVLEREGIPIDCVAGVSAGSLVGAVYCAGLDIPRMRALAAQIGWRDVARPVWPRHGFISFAPMEPFIENMLGELDVRDLSIPFAAVATDLQRGEQVILREGRLATAVRASCSVPGVATPVKFNGRFLCDGGVSDNLPVDAARALGADYVIGVDLFLPGYKPGWGPFSMGLAALETLIRQSGGGCKEADCLIRPALSGQSYFRFSRSEQHMALGEAAAKAMIPQIKQELSRLVHSRKNLCMSSPASS